MNIKERKIELLIQLMEINKECEILMRRTVSYREDLRKVNTEAEAEVFDQTHDLEEGLKHICLF